MCFASFARHSWFPGLSDIEKTKNKKQKNEATVIFGPKGEEILGPDPLLNAKFIRFGPLCHENPVFSFFILIFF